MYFTFMQKKKYSNKICKYESLHEINFIHNEHLDFVFIQQHMHTYIIPFPTGLLHPPATQVVIKKSLTIINK